MSSTPATSDNQSGKKRKQPPMNLRNPRASKWAKSNNARKISSQPSDTAFSDGGLNVEKFVKAREYEIKALEDGLKKSKAVLTTRAFQAVPKDLRRRTASHNVKRVPKRLRQRAAREMIQDNTPTVTARRRKATPHQRLRLETAKRLQKLSSKSKDSRQEKKRQKLDAEVKVSSLEEAPAHPPPVKGPKKPLIEVAAEATIAALKTRKPQVKKSKLRSPVVPPAKFRKRQIYKTWLPTHLYHSKRAHMTPPQTPLWRFALPLTPTAKGYRTTHRATTHRGAVAWDTSYMATMGLEGPEKSIESLLKALGVGAGGDASGPWGKAGMKWRNGTRVWEGWLHERDAWPAKGIAPATIIWNAKAHGEDDVLMGENGDTTSKKKKEKRKAFVRVHPAGFMQLWEQVIRLAKVQKPSVAVEDLRFEIGSVEISGPNATEAMVGSLHPFLVPKETPEPARLDSAEHIWEFLAPQSPSSLPACVLLALDISDPRLQHPPRAVSPPKKPEHADKIARQLCALWPMDCCAKPASIFNRANRLKAQRSLPSQKSINRRKALSDPGKYPNSRPEDPRIPVLLFASRSTNSSAGTWTIMLPWKCIPSIWTSLMYYPLSTGGNVRFGGVQEKRQVAFESGAPWFPGDYPGTRAGDEWEVQEQTKRKAEWEKRPKGRRVEWDSLDLGMGRKGEVGRGWACDWQKLLLRPVQPAPDAKDATPESIPHALAYRVLNGNSITGLPMQPLMTVKITMMTKGVPQTCARVYRLPTNNDDLRKQWLAQLPMPTLTKGNSKKAGYPQRPPPDATPALRRSYLAATILMDAPSQAGDAEYPCVPDEDDLVGFVTTGNFNLGEGRGSGIGSLLLSKVLTLSSNGEGRIVPSTKPNAKDGGTRKEQTLCIVREAGETFGRLARWELA